jgi:AraC-like DNA-binding protein
LEKSLADPMDWLELAGLAHYSAVGMARLLGVSLRQPERIFIEECGQKPQAWLGHRRLWCVVPLVLEGRPEMEFFAGLGFKDATAFFHTFKHYHGCTPGQYMRLLSRHKTGSANRLSHYFAADAPPPQAAENLPQCRHSLEFYALFRPRSNLYEQPDRRTKTREAHRHGCHCG